jgi:transcriptional regulator with PAS, ATPase and Fis domain
LLVEQFLSIYTKKYEKPGLFIVPESMKMLERYSWPGNIRELQHVIERSTILCDGSELRPTDLLMNAPQSQHPEEPFDTYNLEDIEKNIIQKALTNFEGNISQAAKELGLTRTSLYRRMDKFGL